MPIMNLFTAPAAAGPLNAGQWNPDRQSQQGQPDQDREQEQKAADKLPLTAKQLGNSVLQASLAAERQGSSPTLLHTTEHNQAVEVAIHALLQPGYNTDRSTKQNTKPRPPSPNH